MLVIVEWNLQVAEYLVVAILTISDSIITNNFAAAGNEGEGGGIRNSGSMTIINSTISNNFASDQAGGISNTGSLIIINSTIDGNGGGTLGGGGITNLRRGTVVIANSTIANNDAGSFGIGGAGILNFFPDAKVNIINSTISGNLGCRDCEGLGIQNGLFGNDEGTIELLNTIVASNIPGEESNIPDCLGPITSLGNNIIGDTTGCDITLQSSDFTGDPGLGISWTMEPRVTDISHY